MALAAAYARALKALLPPGRIWKLDPDGILSEVLLANGDELARVDARGQDLLRESDATVTDELLPDFERMLDLVADGTLAARRALVTALLIRRQRYRPIDFQNVLAPILGQLPADVVVIERSHAEAVAMGDQREIFRFFIFRDPGAPGVYDIAAAQDIVDRMKPSHTNGQVVQSLNFLCDDPASLCDRDALGV